MLARLHAAGLTNDEATIFSPQKSRVDRLQPLRSSDGSIIVGLAGLQHLRPRLLLYLPASFCERFIISIDIVKVGFDVDVSRWAL